MSLSRWKKRAQSCVKFRKAYFVEGKRRCALYELPATAKAKAAKAKAATEATEVDTTEMNIESTLDKKKSLPFNNH
ncbi:hypothetical protein M0802_000134 [Mischocyttarus mexicanus]|nr:hypothetical protein M0802_000134 [Mischocyttarus mexicanus]